MTRIPQNVREQVRKRARGRCEYCLLPEQFSYQPHQIDHIRSIKHGGSDAIDNLAWACADCNNAKGTDVGAFDDVTETYVRFFNPRIHTWDEHFEVIEGVITGKTPIGRVTVQLFQLNRGEQVETRLALIEAGLWD